MVGLLLWFVNIYIFTGLRGGDDLAYIRNCILCGKEFEAPNGFVKRCPDQHYAVCKVCGNRFPIDCEPNQIPQTCSKECRKVLAAEKRKATVKSKYGVDNVSELSEVRDKLSEVNSSKEVKAKRAATCIQNWGVDNPSKSEIVKAKQRATFQHKYGVDNPMKDPSISKLISDIMSDPEHVEAHRQHLLEKYGVKCTNDIPGVRDKMIETTLKNHGVPYYVMSPEYLTPKKSSVISKINESVAKEFNRAGLETEFEFRVDTKLYDIHIVGTNILIEVDPTYTHNSIGNHWDKYGLDKNYHTNKTRLAQKYGYRCIHLFDWDNLNTIIDMVRSDKVKYYARKMRVEEVSKQLADEFISCNHLQRRCRGNTVNIGLFNDDELIEIMTFGTPRYNKKYQWELLRLCTRRRCEVVGGANKLFKYFVNKYSPHSVISYCDSSKFSGQVYSNLGFSHVRDTEPQRVWSRGSSKITDNLLRQRGYDQLFGTHYGKGSSNDELMLQAGWLPVYDCGQKTFEWIEGLSHEKGM